MPPRGSDTPVKRGYVVRHKSGYRVQAKINKTTVRGPVRRTESEANSDLQRVQLLPNGQYISAPAQLQRGPQKRGPQNVRRGKVLSNYNGFRVQATIDKMTLNGPTRSIQARFHVKGF